MSTSIAMLVLTMVRFSIVMSARVLAPEPKLTHNVTAAAISFTLPGDLGTTFSNQVTALLNGGRATLEEDISNLINYNKAANDVFTSVKGLGEFKFDSVTPMFTIDLNQLGGSYEVKFEGKVGNGNSPISQKLDFSILELTATSKLEGAASLKFQGSATYECVSPFSAELRQSI